MINDICHRFLIINAIIFKQIKLNERNKEWLLNKVDVTF